MTQLTDEAVRRLTEVLTRLEQGSPGPGPGPAPAPSPLPNPADLAETQAQLAKVAEQMQKLNDVTEDTKETLNSFSESIERSFKLDELEAQRVFLVARTQALEDLKTVQEDANASTLDMALAEQQFKTAMEDATEALKQTQSRLKGEGGLTKELDKLFASFTGGGIKTGGFADKLRGLGVQFSKARNSTADLGKVLKRAAVGAVFGRLMKAADALVNATIALAKAQDKSISSFRKATGAGKEYNLEITRLNRQTQFAGVSIEKAGKAYNTLFDSMSAFTQLSKSERNTIGQTTTLLAELGVGAQTTAQIFDQLNRSLGMGVAESNDVLLRLAGTAKSLGVSMGKMAKDFQSSFGELSKYGKDAVNVFEGLAKQSKATGLEVGKLMGLAKQFDTFENAAQSVGRLNAIMGGPYLNSIDMLNASEAERIDLLKASVDAAGIQFDAMNRFEKQAIAAAMGMSVEEASRIMGMSTAEMELQAMQQEELADLAQNSQQIMEQVKNAMRSLVVDTRPLVENFIVPMVEALGKFGKWLGNAESGLTRFVKMGATAAALALIIAAPFTGGSSLALLVGLAALLGGGAYALAGGGEAGAGGEEGATATDDLEGFYSSPGLVPKSGNREGTRAEAMISINEIGEERLIVPYGTYVASAEDVRRSNKLAEVVVSELRGLRQDLAAGASSGDIRIVVQDEEFAATLVDRSGISPFGGRFAGGNGEVTR